MATRATRPIQGVFTFPIISPLPAPGEWRHSAIPIMAEKQTPCKFHSEKVRMEPTDCDMQNAKCGKLRRPQEVSAWPS